MATFQKRGNAWRAIVRRAGQTVTATFDTRAEADTWAIAAESKIMEGARVQEGKVGFVTVADLLSRYATEVSPTKRGERWEVIRLEMLIKYFPVFAAPVSKFSPEDIADWRDARLKTVSSGSVNRELNLISAVFTTAIKEWRLPLKENPVHLIRRPKNPQSRKRRVEDAEVESVCAQLGWDRKSPPTLTKHWIAFSFALAVETAMRKGEILNVTWRHVHLAKRFIHLPHTKNDESRDVPLSSRAIALLSILPEGKSDEYVVPVNSGSFDTMFREAVRAAKIENLHFHDSRHEATTRLSAMLPNVLELAAVTGHKTLKMLQIYYNPKASDLAAKLG